jgi:hypothetical protein
LQCIEADSVADGAGVHGISQLLLAYSWLFRTGNPKAAQAEAETRAELFKRRNARGRFEGLRAGA